MTVHPTRPRLRSLIGAAVALSLLAGACGASDGPVEALATNQGAISVKPPDVLDGSAEAESAAAPDAATQAAPVEGLESTPVVDFVYFDGTPGSTAEFSGRPVVINFWASNCPPCIAEMPEFEEASQALAGQVDFVGLNVNDTSREAALDMAERTGVTYPLAEDVDSKVFRAFGAFVMPTTIFLNAQGQVAYSWFGVLTESELRKLIDEHIAPGTADV